MKCNILEILAERKEQALRRKLLGLAVRVMLDPNAPTVAGKLPKFKPFLPERCKDQYSISRNLPDGRWMILKVECSEDGRIEREKIGIEKAQEFDKSYLMTVYYDENNKSTTRKAQTALMSTEDAIALLKSFEPSDSTRTFSEDEMAPFCAGGMFSTLRNFDRTIILPQASEIILGS